MRVFVPSQLQSYTAGATQVDAVGRTVDEVLRHLDKHYPGIRFRIIDEQGRIRRHMRLFVGADTVKTVAQIVRTTDELLIFGALSGG